MDKFYEQVNEAVFDLMVAVGKHPAFKKNKEVIIACRKLNTLRREFKVKINERLLVNGPTKR